MSDFGQSAKPRIFVFGTGKTGHAALTYLLGSEENIVGVCTKKNVFVPSFLFRLKVTCVQCLFDMGLYEPHDQILHDFKNEISGPADLALAQNIPCFDLGSLKSDDFYEAVKALNPDLILCFGFPKLVPQRILDLARISAVNIHPGFLPARGGGTPVRWAIVKGDKQVGLTAHVMTAKFDAGKIVAERSIPLLNDDDSASLEGKLINVFPDLMCDVLKFLRDGVLEKDVASTSPPDILPPMHKDFSRINWNEHGSNHISRIVRAMKPKGSVFTYLNGKQIYFWDVSVISNYKSDQNAKPGQVISIDNKEGLVIKTIDGAICVRNALFGYKLRPASFIVRRLKIKISDCFV